MSTGNGNGGGSDGDGPGNGNDSGTNGASSDGNGNDGQGDGGVGGYGGDSGGGRGGSTSDSDMGGFAAEAGLTGDNDNGSGWGDGRGPGGGSGGNSQSAAVDAALGNFFGDLDDYSAALSGMPADSLQSMVDESTPESALSRYGMAALKGGLMGLFSGNLVGGLFGAATAVGKEAIGDLVGFAYDSLKSMGVSDDRAREVSVAAEPVFEAALGDKDFMSGLESATRNGDAGFAESFVSNYIENPTKWKETWVEPKSYDNGMPTDIPSQFTDGIAKYVNSSQSATDQYQEDAQALEDDYLAFEQTFAENFDNIMGKYNAMISTMPQVNLTMPDTMGGGMVALAPKVHSAMYGDQLAARNSTLMNQANTKLAGLGSRDALAKNVFGVNQSNLTNSLMPTQTGLDLYKMERAGDLGLQQVNASRPDEPSTLSTWAPVVGSVLSSDAGQSAIDSTWDFVSDLFT